MATNAHIILFPYFLYPGQSLAMTGSIFIIVAIALERYVYFFVHKCMKNDVISTGCMKNKWHFFSLLCRYIAVHNPIDYKQCLNDSNAMKKRVAKYLLPVIFGSILFNIPKFFEATYYLETVQV